MSTVCREILDNFRHFLILSDCDHSITAGILQVTASHYADPTMKLLRAMNVNNKAAPGNEYTTENVCLRGTDIRGP